MYTASHTPCECLYIRQTIWLSLSSNWRAFCVHVGMDFIKEYESKIPRYSDTGTWAYNLPLAVSHRLVLSFSGTIWRGWFERNPLTNYYGHQASSWVVPGHKSIFMVYQSKKMWSSWRRCVSICLFALCANFAYSKRLKAAFQTNSMQSKLL